VDLGFTAILLSFFFRHLISELAEQNSTISGHLVGSKCDLKMNVQNLGYPLPLQIGGPKSTFYDDFETYRQIWRPISSERNELQTIGQVRYKLQGVSSIVSKQHELWSTNGLKLDRNFHPPSENCAFFFIAGFRTCTSEHRTQSNFVTRKG